MARTDDEQTEELSSSATESTGSGVSRNQLSRLRESTDSQANDIPFYSRPFMRFRRARASEGADTMQTAQMSTQDERDGCPPDSQGSEMASQPPRQRNRPFSGYLHLPSRHRSVDESRTTVHEEIGRTVDGPVSTVSEPPLTTQPSQTPRSRQTISSNGAREKRPRLPTSPGIPFGWLLQCRIICLISTLLYNITSAVAYWGIHRSLKKIAYPNCVPDYTVTEVTEKTSQKEFASSTSKMFVAPERERGDGIAQTTEATERAADGYHWVNMIIYVVQAIAIVPVIAVGIVIIYFVLVGLYHDLQNVLDRIVRHNNPLEPPNIPQPADAIAKNLF